MTLTMDERETIITFNEAEPMAKVYTYNPKLKRRLKLMAESDEPSAMLLTDDGLGGLTYEIDKHLLTIRTKKRGGREYTPEQKTAARERLAALRQERSKV